ncbi:palmitoyltransferase ZDHHC12 [Spea bombifrons]|uniref:palmitoyltransferase ZDHHC12 n=1 Tax=Spea bombifrons TaxID=233779 RepID=UPI0023490045|nr:palmitoyltransferase ZDHHC12 [Spea bombifrons]
MYHSVFGAGIWVRTVHTALTLAVALILCLHDTDLWYEEKRWRALQPLGFVFLVLCSTGLYYVVSLMDPGYVLSDPDEKPLAPSEEQEGLIPGTPNPINPRRCGYCLLKQPMRARHCKCCQRCVRRYDHHCPWIENCVGEKNHPLFVLYLCVQLGVLLWAFRLGWSGFHFEATWNQWFTENVVLLLAFAVISVFTVVVALLLVCHLYLISCNVTTWEFMSFHRISYLKHCDSDTSPFDEGVIRNTWSFFCAFGSVAWERVYSRDAYVTV